MDSHQFYLDVGMVSDRGQRRPHQEDFCQFHNPMDLSDMDVAGSLFLVADGVGGGTAGGRASKYAVEHVLHDYYHHDSEDLEERLSDAFRSANRGVFDFASDLSSGKGVGTTLVAAITFGERLVIGNVGDSRAYRLRGNQVTQLTKDHSLVQQLLDAGELAPEEVSTFPKRNVLTRCIGAEMKVHPDFFDHVLEEGDILVLCSDGFHNYLETSQELDVLIDRDMPAQGIAEKLVELANRRGGADNITALVVRVLHPSKAATLPEDELATMIPGRLRAPSPLDGARPSAGRKFLVKPPIILTTVAIIAFVGLVGGLAVVLKLGSANSPELAEGLSGEPTATPAASVTDEATAKAVAIAETTVVSPTETSVAPTETAVPSTNTSVPPTETAVPETETPVIVETLLTATDIAAGADSSETESTEPNCLYNVKEGDNLPFIAADALGLPRGTDESTKVVPKIDEIMDDNRLSDEIIIEGQELILFWQNEDNPLTEEGADNSDGELPECPKVSQ